MGATGQWDAEMVGDHGGGRETYRAMEVVYRGLSTTGGGNGRLARIPTCSGWATGRSGQDVLGESGVALSCKEQAENPFPPRGATKVERRLMGAMNSQTEG